MWRRERAGGSSSACRPASQPARHASGGEGEASFLALPACLPVHQAGWLEESAASLQDEEGAMYVLLSLLLSHHHVGSRPSKQASTGPASQTFILLLLSSETDEPGLMKTDQATRGQASRRLLQGRSGEQQQQASGREGGKGGAASVDKIVYHHGAYSWDGVISSSRSQSRRYHGRWPSVGRSVGPGVCCCIVQVDVAWGGL